MTPLPKPRIARTLSEEGRRPSMSRVCTE
ncbi:MAG: hypothetical protein QOI63_1752, partial [Thermoplasmata archaeon]|nr:hypothetical protein [Thermoplasmata archaeon]